VTEEGLTLEEVQFSNVTGDGQTDAIVCIALRYRWHNVFLYIYVYTFADGKPKLLACFTPVTAPIQVFTGFTSKMGG